MHTLLLVAALSAHLLAQPESLPGRYILAPEASDDVTALVEAAVRDVSPVKRGRMRSELLAQLRPSPSLVIRAEANGFVILDATGRELRVTPGAPASRLTTPKGEPATIDAAMREGALVLRVRTERASREQRFVRDGAGLAITSTLTTGALDAPITLRMVYRQAVP